MAYIYLLTQKFAFEIVFTKGFEIIGSAHNQKIELKVKQGCKTIIYSRLFHTNYHYKGHLGVQRFNIVSLRSKLDLVPLGGINETNLNKLNNVISKSFACLSALKKSRLN